MGTAVALSTSRPPFGLRTLATGALMFVIVAMYSILVRSKETPRDWGDKGGEGGAIGGFD